jgi:hypothetical protein
VPEQQHRLGCTLARDGTYSVLPVARAADCVVDSPVVHGKLGTSSSEK